MEAPAAVSQASLLTTSNDLSWQNIELSNEIILGIFSELSIKDIANVSQVQILVLLE